MTATSDKSQFCDPCYHGKEHEKCDGWYKLKPCTCAEGEHPNRQPSPPTPKPKGIVPVVQKAAPPKPRRTAEDIAEILAHRCEDWIETIKAEAKRWDASAGPEAWEYDQLEALGDLVGGFVDEVTGFIEAYNEPPMPDEDELDEETAHVISGSPPPPAPPPPAPTPAASDPAVQ